MVKKLSGGGNDEFVVDEDRLGGGVMVMLGGDVKVWGSRERIK